MDLPEQERIKHLVVSLVILVLGVYVRIQNLENNFYFSGELGDNLLKIKDFIETKNIPLTGPETSHSWLSFGPLYYWLMAPFLMIFDFNPLVSVYVTIFSTLLTMILNLILVKRVFNRKIAYISTFLIAISPLGIWFSQSGRFYYLVIPVIYLLYFTLWDIWKNKKNFFTSGFWFGVALNFHYSPFLLVPAIVFLFWRKRIQVRNILKLSAGFLFALSPLIIFDFKSNFMMLRSLVFWIPYRVMGFLGFYPKNNFSLSSFLETANGIFNFIGKIFVSEKETGFVLATILFFFLLRNFYIQVTTKKFNFFFIMVVMTILVGFGGLLVHGRPPLHYFLPLFPSFVIFSSFLLGSLHETKNGKILVYLLFAILIFKSFLIPNLFSNSSDFVPYKVQQEVAKYIIIDSGSQPFILHRVGPFDNFEEDYSQNYRYLLAIMGNRPKKDGVSLVYTIYEGKDKLPDRVEKNQKIFQISDVYIIKIE